jgi:four helix bundle protein
LAEKITSHRDLRVYQQAFESAMHIFMHTKAFPDEERYTLIDQMRRSSRSVCANLAEAWRNRRYEKSFISKLSDAEAEAGETQVWIEFSVRLGYLSTDEGNKLYIAYNEILRTIIGMINHPESWIITPKKLQAEAHLYGETGPF